MVKRRHQLRCYRVCLRDRLSDLSVSPQEDISTAHGTDAMIYADQTQLYIILKKHDFATAVQRLENCLYDIQAWCWTSADIFRNMFKTLLFNQAIVSS